MTSNVEGAQVYIGREKVSFFASPDEGWIYRGTAPYRTHDFPPGDHEIRVVKDGYDAEIRRVTIGPEGLTEVEIKIFKTLPDSMGEDHGGGDGGS